MFRRYFLLFPFFFYASTGHKYKIQVKFKSDGAKFLDVYL